MSFEIKDRYLKVFEDLEQCVINNDKDNIIDIIPQITRLYLTDSPNVFDDFNKYDLFIPIPVSEEINKLILINHEVSLSKGIYVSHTKQIAFTNFEFINAVIGYLNGKPIKIIDFIQSIGYHGTLHVKPSPEKTFLIDIYNKVILPNQNICYDILFQIGSSYISAFKEVLSEIFVSTNLFTIDHNKQPQIFLGPPARLLYDECYSQGRFETLQSKGLLISLGFEPLFLNINRNQYLFSIGHTKTFPYSISVYLTNDCLVCTIYSGSERFTSSVRIKQRKTYNISIELYPNSHVNFRVNNEKKVIKLDKTLILANGKIVLGANLNGEKRSKFFCDYFQIETINENGYLAQYRSFSLNKVNYAFKHISKCFIN